MNIIPNLDNDYKYRKSFMDLFFPGLLLAATFIWKDFFMIIIHRIVEKINIKSSVQDQYDPEFWSALFTALIITGIGIVIAFVKRDWETRYKA